MHALKQYGRLAIPTTKMNYFHIQNKVPTDYSLTFSGLRATRLREKESGFIFPFFFNEYVSKIYLTH